jgi:hypothetical protein
MWINVLFLAGLAMGGIVLADDNHWTAAAITYALFALLLYFLGTAAYRLSVKGDGRIEAHSLLGLRPIDLRNGFLVKKAWFGPAIVVLRASGKRCRINGALGGSVAIEEWLRGAANR